MRDSDDIDYLTPAELYAIAQEVLGREPDVRDRHLLRAAAARPITRVFGHEAYPTLIDKAAALLHSLAAHHLFFDGNKRTATAATITFLERNGLRPTWDDKTIYNFVLEVAQDRHTVESIAEWLTANTEPVE